MQSGRRPARLLEDLASIRAAAPIRTSPPPYVQQRLHTLISRAAGTTGIEGANLSEEEVSAVLRSRGPTRACSLPAEGGTRSPQRAGSWRSGNVTLKLTEPLVREFHSVLTIGRLPAQQPWPIPITPAGPGGYQTPPPENVPNLMSREWLNRPGSLDPIVKRLPRTSSSSASILSATATDARPGVSRASALQGGRELRFSLAYRNRGLHPSLRPIRLRPECWPVPGLCAQGPGRQVHAELLSAVRIISFRDYARERLQKRLGTKTGNRQLLFLSWAHRKYRCLQEWKACSWPLLSGRRTKDHDQGPECA